MYTETKVLKYALPRLDEIRRLGGLAATGRGGDRFANSIWNFAKAEILGSGFAIRNMENLELIGYSDRNSRWIPSRDQSALFSYNQHTRKLTRYGLPTLARQDSVELRDLPYFENMQVFNNDEKILAVNHGYGRQSSTFFFVFSLKDGTCEKKWSIPGALNLVAANSSGILVCNGQKLFRSDFGSRDLIDLEIEAEKAVVSYDKKYLAVAIGDELKVLRFSDLKIEFSIQLSHRSNNLVAWGINANTLFVGNDSQLTICRTDCKMPVLKLPNSNFGLQIPAVGNTAISNRRILSSIPYHDRWKKIQSNSKHENSLKTRSLAVELLEKLVDEHKKLTSENIVAIRRYSSVAKSAALQTIHGIRDLQSEAIGSGKWQKLHIREYILTSKKSDVAVANSVIVDAMLDDWSLSYRRVNGIVWSLVSTNKIEGRELHDNFEFMVLLDRLVEKNQARQSGPEINTIGVAKFRLEAFQEAVSWLEKSRVLNQEEADLPIPGDSAFLAMAYLKLGKTSNAEKYRKLFDEAMQLEENQNDGTMALLRKLKKHSRMKTPRIEF